MNEAMTWLAENGDLILELGAALLTLATGVVRLTPTPADDEFLAHVIRFLGRFSWLHPNGGWKAPGTKADVGSADGAE